MNNPTAVDIFNAVEARKKSLIKQYEAKELDPKEYVKLMQNVWTNVAKEIGYTG